MTAAEAGGPRALVVPVAAMIISMACFQVGAAFAKGLFPAVGAEGAAALRLFFAAIMLTALARPWRSWPARAPLWPLVGLGVTSAAAMLLFYMAIARLPQGIAIALQFLGPLTVAVAGSRRPRDLLWALLAGAGVWGLVGHRVPGLGRLDLLGVVCALGAAAGWGGYILFGRRAGQSFGNATAALATTIAAVIVVPVGLIHAGAALFAPALLPLALLVALVSVAVPFSLELYALPKMPARTFAVFTSLEPAFGALTGFVLLHEQLAAPQLLGVAAVMTAAAGAAWSSGRQGRAELAEAPLD
jgi:inner membrane transporter RhtA